MSGERLRRYRAERLLREQLAAARPRVVEIARKRLRGYGVEIDESDLEECYMRAWHGLYAALLAGRQIEDHVGWLVVATVRRALEDSRSLVRQATELTGAVERLTARHAPQDPDFAGELDRRRRLRELFEALRMRLTAREREAATLCYLYGYSRAQAAAHMGISQTRMRKLMDGVEGRQGLAGKWGQLLAQIGADGWCEEQDSLIRAYAMGVHDPEGERHGWAAAHLDECPRCRAMVAALRRLAAVLPPLPLVPLPPVLAPASPRAGRARSAPAGGGKGGTLVVKVVATGALAVAGGGYAVLAGSAPGHSTPTTVPIVLQGNKVVAQHVVKPAHMSLARKHPRAHIHVSSTRPTQTAVGPARQAQPLNEFTPERAPAKK